MTFGLWGYFCCTGFIVIVWSSVGISKFVSQHDWLKILFKGCRFVIQSVNISSKIFFFFSPSPSFLSPTHATEARELSAACGALVF